MTAAELKDVMQTLDLNDPHKRDWLIAACFIGVVEALENIREEIIAHKLILEESDDV